MRWILVALIMYLLVFCGRNWFEFYSNIYPDNAVKAVCREMESVSTLNYLTVKPDLSIIGRTENTSLPNDQLKLLALLNAEFKPSVLCQVGFNPFVVLAQFALNPDSSVYSFHRFESSEERDLANKIKANNTHYVPIIGNPMHTVRAFAREFGPNGHALGPNPLLDLVMTGRTGATNLGFNNTIGITCDIIHFEEGSYEELLVMALLADKYTSIIYNNKNGARAEVWKSGRQNNIVYNACPKELHVDADFGRYTYGYAAVEDNDTKKPAYDISNLIQEFKASLKEVLASVAKDGLVIWIPLGKAHQHLANNLYCSLVQNNVTNYLFFAHDRETYDYAVAHNRTSFFSSLWFTPIQGKQVYHMFNYNVVMRERFALLLDILELGYDILLNDADTVWVSDVLPDLESPHHIVAQEDTDGNGKFSEVCGGFVLFKSRPVVKELLHVMQQLAFLFPWLEDQEISNLIYKSNFTCLVLYNTTEELACPSKTHSLTVQYKDPKLYVSGHYYCGNHAKWQQQKVVPKMIHLNGANKDVCITNSKGWGYEMSDKCMHPVVIPPPTVQNPPTPIPPV